MIRNGKWILMGILILVWSIAMLNSCKKEAPAPANPYNSINRNDTTSNAITADSLTITYLHQKVLSTRCALNGCHEGHFEPDFRTPMSAFASLVFAPITKNDTARRYKFRVIPNDTTRSVLYQRITNCCFVNTNDRMPQDNIGVPLPDSSIHMVARWIMNGARDMYGNIPTRPDEPVIINGYFAISTNYQTGYSNNRLDSIYSNPFVLPAAVNSFYLVVVDTDDITPTTQFRVNTLKLSLNATDFSNATTVQATYLNANGPQYWVATVNPTNFPVGDTVYMRYYVNDGTHTSNTEFPNAGSNPLYYTYWSFVRQ